MQRIVLFCGTMLLPQLLGHYEIKPVEASGCGDNRGCLQVSYVYPRVMTYVVCSYSSAAHGTYIHWA